MIQANPFDYCDFALSRFSEALPKRSVGSNASNFSRISSSDRSDFQPYAAKTISSSRLWPDNPTHPLHYPGALPGRFVGRIYSISMYVNFGHCQELELYWIELR